MEQNDILLNLIQIQSFLLESQACLSNIENEKISHEAYCHVVKSLDSATDIMEKLSNIRINFLIRETKRIVNGTE